MPTLKFERYSVGCGWRRRQGATNFAPFGRGVQLYFGFLHTMSCAAAVLCLLHIPALLLFAGGSAVRQSGASILAAASLGNLGESSSVCATGNEGTTLRLVCPHGAVMTHVEALFGAATGSCDCPADRSPSPSCPAALDGSACSPATGYCFLSTERLVRLPSGREYTTGPCCSSTLTPRISGGGLFDDLNPAQADTACAGDPAVVARIASAICTGQGTCILEVNASSLVRYSPPAGLSCPGQARSINDTCVESLGSGGAAALSGCAASPSYNASRGLQLLLAARCDAPTVDLSWSGPTYRVSRLAIGQAAASFVTVSLVVVCAAIFVIRRSESAGSKRGMNDGNNADTAFASAVSAADFTVILEGLPRDVSSLVELERELRAHLCAVLTNALPVSVRLPNGISIADVNFGADSGLLRLFTQRGAVVRQIERAARLKVQAADGRRAAALVRCTVLLKSLLQQLTALDEKIDGMEDWISGRRLVQGIADGKAPARLPRLALVTFDNEESALRAISTYGVSPCNWLCQKREVRLRGHRLHARRAPEPSDVLFSNLAVTCASRVMRRVGTSVLLLGFLLLALYLVFLAEENRRRVGRENPVLDCGALWSTTHGNSTLSVDLFTKADVVRDVYWKQFGATTGNAGVLGCFCKAALFSEGPAALLFVQFDVPPPGASGIPPPLTASAPLCANWLSLYVAYEVSTYGVSVLTLAINLVFRAGVEALVRWERHETRSQDMHARGLYYFLLYLTTTTLLLLLLNARIGQGAGSSILLLSSGTMTDFTSAWYSTVCTSVVFAVSVNVLVLNTVPLADAAYRALRRWWDRRQPCCGGRAAGTHVLTQSELNELQLGSTLLLEERYAQAAASIFTCLAYAGGAPLLMPVLAASLTLQYWVDRYLFVACHRTPPRTGASLPRAFSALLPLAGVLYAGFAAWMLSYEPLLPLAQGETQLAASVLWSDSDAPPTSAVSWSVFVADVRGVRTVLSRGFAPHIAPITVLGCLLFVTAVVGAATVLGRRCAGLCLCSECAVRAPVCCSCCRPKLAAKGLPSYFFAYPPDVVETALTGLFSGKPHIRNRLAESSTERKKLLTHARLSSLGNVYRMAVEAAAEVEEEASQAQADVGSLAAQKELLFPSSSRAPPVIKMKRAALPPVTVLAALTSAPLSVAPMPSPGNPFGPATGELPSPKRRDSQGNPFGAAPLPPSALRSPGLAPPFSVASYGNPFDDEPDVGGGVVSATTPGVGAPLPVADPPQANPFSTPAVQQSAAPGRRSSLSALLARQMALPATAAGTGRRDSAPAILQKPRAAAPAPEMLAAADAFNTASTGASPLMLPSKAAVEWPPVRETSSRHSAFRAQPPSLSAAPPPRLVPLTTDGDDEAAGQDDDMPGAYSNTSLALEVSTSRVEEEEAKDGGEGEHTSRRLAQHAADLDRITRGLNLALARASKMAELARACRVRVDAARLDLARYLRTSPPSAGGSSASPREEGDVEGPDGGVPSEQSPWIDGPCSYDVNEDRDIAAALGLDAGLDRRFKRRMGARGGMEGVVEAVMARRREREARGRPGELDASDVQLEVAAAGLMS